MYIRSRNILGAGKRIFHLHLAIAAIVASTIVNYLNVQCGGAYNFIGTISIIDDSCLHVFLLNCLNNSANVPLVPLFVHTASEEQ